MAERHVHGLSPQPPTATEKRFRAAAMEVAVDGEDITPEDFASEEWAEIRRKQRALSLKITSTTGSPNTAPEVVSPNSRKSRPLRRGPPMERLPETDIKIVLRPRGGLDLKSVAPATIANTISKSAPVPLSSEDQVRVHQNSNYILISTPDDMRARKFASIRSLVLHNKQYDISTHVSAPANTVLGIIFKIPEDDTPEDITRNVVDFNPDLPILSVKRLGKTDAAQILFDGYKIPFWIRYGYTTYRCTPFRHKTEACTQCWQRGHRHDVCPNPTTRCPKCGIVNPSEGHPCKPRCVVCGGAHLTGTTACPHRFKPRRPLRPPPDTTKGKEEKAGTPPSTLNHQEWPALPECGSPNTQTPPRGRPPSRSQSKHKSRSPSASRAKANAKTWATPPNTSQKTADNGKSVSFDGGASHLCTSYPPPQNPAKELLTELAKIKAEMAALRKENNDLKQEILRLRSQNAAISQPNSTDQESTSPAPKKRAIALASSQSPNPVEESPQQQELERKIVALGRSNGALHENVNTMQNSIESFRSEMNLYRTELHNFMHDIMNRLGIASNLISQTEAQNGPQQ